MSILTRPFGYSATRPDTFLRLARVSLFPVSALCWRSGAAQTGSPRTECAQPAPTASELTVLPPPSITCLTGIRDIRVNVRFVQTPTGGDNFGPVDLPITPFDDNGYRWAQGMIWVANWPGGWSQNTQMRLPVGNSTAVLPKRIQLVLTGGYFDKVPAAYQSTERLWYYLGGRHHSNAFSPYLFDTCGTDSVIQYIHTYRASQVPSCSGGGGARPAFGNLSPDQPVLEAHPNPATNAATLTYLLPAAGEVTLVLLNAQGQTGRELLPQTALAAGTHELTVSTEALPDGYYQVQLTTGGKRAVTSLVVHH